MDTENIVHCTLPGTSTSTCTALHSRDWKISTSTNTCGRWYHTAVVVALYRAIKQWTFQPTEPLTIDIFVAASDAGKQALVYTTVLCTMH